MRLFPILLLLCVGCQPVPKETSPDLQAGEKLIYNATILTMNPAFEVVESGFVRIIGDKIVEIGQTEPADFRGLKLNAEGMILMPGFVNTHTHLPMTLFRGMADDLPLDRWLQDYIWPAEAQFLNPRTIGIGTRLALAEMIQSGTTTFNDMYFFEDVIAQEASRAGMRGLVGSGISNFANGGDTAAALQTAEQLIVDWKENERIYPTVTPHSIYTCSAELLEKARDMAQRHEVPIHIHLSETEREVENAQRDLGTRPVAYLDKLGLFDVPVIGAHCVWINGTEINALTEKAFAVATNPSSNLKLGSGTPPIPAYMKAGIPVGLGTDGAASNNNLDILEEIRLVGLLYNPQSADEEDIVDAQVVLEMATIGGARALRLDDRIGSIEVGKQADLILIDPRSLAMQPMYDLYSAIVYALPSQSIWGTMVAGEFLMYDRVLQTMDEASIRTEVDSIQRVIQQYIAQQKQP